MLKIDVPAHATVFEHGAEEEVVVDFNNGWSVSITAQPMVKQHLVWSEPRYQLSVFYECGDETFSDDTMTDLTKAEVEYECSRIGMLLPAGSLPPDYDFGDVEFAPLESVEGEYVYT